MASSFSPVDLRNRFLDSLKANSPFGYVACINQNGSYVIKELEYIEDVIGPDTVTYVGFEITEPLFCYYVCAYYVDGVIRNFIQDDMNAYFTPLETAFNSLATLPDKENFKLGLEHFRKVGTWFVIKVRQEAL